jgi:hypothetical protein
MVSSWLNPISTLFPSFGSARVTTKQHVPPTNSTNPQHNATSMPTNNHTGRQQHYPLLVTAPYGGPLHRDVEAALVAVHPVPLPPPPLPPGTNNRLHQSDGEPVHRRPILTVNNNNNNHHPNNDCMDVSMSSTTMQQQQQGPVCTDTAAAATTSSSIRSGNLSTVDLLLLDNLALTSGVQQQQQSSTTTQRAPRLPTTKMNTIPEPQVLHPYV